MRRTDLSSKQYETPCVNICLLSYFFFFFFFYFFSFSLVLGVGFICAWSDVFHIDFRITKEPSIDIKCWLTFPKNPDPLSYLSLLHGHETVAIFIITSLFEKRRAPLTTFSRKWRKEIVRITTATYFCSVWVFQTNCEWFSFTEVKVTASLFRSFLRILADFNSAMV